MDGARKFVEDKVIGDLYSTTSIKIKQGTLVHNNLLSGPFIIGQIFLTNYSMTEVSNLKEFPYYVLAARVAMLRSSLCISVML